MAIYKKTLGMGVVLGITFWVVLVIMFMPFFGGVNAFDASDRLFNSISKGSTYKIPKLSEEAKKYDGKMETLELKIKDKSIRADAQKIFAIYKIDVDASGDVLKINEDYGKILAYILKDADDMFYNKGEEIKKRVGMNERKALFTWWHILKAVERAFNDKGGKENFAASKMAHEIKAKGIEVGYNYYKIKPESVGSKAGILFSALLFYVIYTLWWGYSIYLIAEGLGLQLSGGKKKEM